MTAKTYTDILLFRRLLHYARPYGPHIVGIFLLSLLSTPLALLTPLPLKIAVDSVIGIEPIPHFLDMLLPAAATQSAATTLIVVVGLLMLITLLKQLQELMSSVLHTYTGEKLLLDFRAQLFCHSQRLSLTYHDTKGTADTTYRIQYDASAIRYVTIDGVVPLVTASFTLVSMLYITFQLDQQLAFIALSISPILFIIARVYRQRLRQQSREVKKLESVALSVVQEVLTALRIVKAFGQEDREQKRFLRQSRAGLGARIHLTMVEGSMGLLLGLTMALGTAAVLFIGVRHVLQGILTLGDLLLVMGYLSQLYDPLKTISRKTARLQSYLASAERALTLLDQPSDVAERPNARPITRVKGFITLRDVSFSYHDKQPVLSHISVDVPAGTRVGIAGKTGAGKTTLMSLLPRFYDPTAGQVLLDGLDLRDYRLADLRNQFSIVLQDTILFSTTIAENIAYTRPGASEQEVVEAARAANAHDFIASLPNGYQTQVGERGMRLSGGERQRIALARAFLKDAPILIMDEPTSSVDMKTETEIMEAIEKLMNGRTTFMIAHRLSTLEHCDLLLVVEEGRLLDMTSDVSMTVKEMLPSDRLVPAISGDEVYV